MVDYKGSDLLIDEEDIKWLAKYKYRLAGTANRYLTREGGALHRDIMQCPEGLVVDHINGNTLDNRKKNLRVVSHSQNQLNPNNKPLSNNALGIRGVVWNKHRKKYKASITWEGKDIFLGYTDDFFEACCMRKSAENKVAAGVRPQSCKLDLSDIDL